MTFLRPTPRLPDGVPDGVLRRAPAASSARRCADSAGPLMTRHSPPAADSARPGQQPGGQSATCPCSGQTSLGGQAADELDRARFRQVPLPRLGDPLAAADQPARKKRRKRKSCKRPQLLLRPELANAT
eukprot:3726579-Pyramimonas_sp.AAC.1